MGVGGEEGRRIIYSFNLLIPFPDLVLYNTSIHNVNEKQAVSRATTPVL